MDPDAPTNSDLSGPGRRDDLRKRSVRGGAITVTAEGFKFALVLASTAILARILTPADFGLVAMVATVTNFVARFKDLGLSMSTVQRAEINHRQVSTLFWINAGFGLLVTILTALLAPAVAWFYGDPRLTRITIVLAFAFIFGGLSVQHQALLRRQMSFGRLAAVQLASTLVGIAAGIAGAYFGAGYWALVIMQLTTALIGMAGMWIVCSWRPGRPVRDADVGSMLAFGGNLTAANLLGYVTRNLDNVLIGWKWGTDALGLYSKAYHLLMLPIRQFNTPVTAVALPVLSSLQSDPDQYRLYYKKGIQLLTTFGMPLVAFTFVDADKVILLLLGDKWTEAIQIFRLLAPAAFVGTFNVATGWVYISLGQTKRQLLWAGIALPVKSIAFLIGLHWGPMGVAAAFSLAVCTLRIPGILFCYKETQLTFRDLLSAVWRPAAASILAGVAVAAIQGILIYDFHPLLGFGLDFLLYGTVLLLIWCILPKGRQILREILLLAKDLKPQAEITDEDAD